MIVLQFPLPSNDALVVSDHVIGRCKYGKCLTIYYDDLTLFVPGCFKVPYVPGGGYNLN